MTEQEYREKMLSKAEETRKYTRLIYKNVAFMYYAGVALGVALLIAKYA